MSSTSANKGYTIPAVGGDNNTWGNELNTTLGLIDQNLGGTYSVSVAGNANVTVTAANAANLFHVLSGALTGSIQYILPAGLGGEFVVTNSTSGAYTVTVITAGGSGVVVPQGTTITVNSNGTNCSYGLTGLVGPISVSGTLTGGTYAGLTLSGTTTLADGGTLTSSGNKFSAITGFGIAPLTGFAISAHGATNQNFGVQGGVLVSGAVALSAVNDANNANIPFEYRASTHNWYSTTPNAITMQLSASGNLGLGVTPSAWTSAGFSATEFGAAGNAVVGTLNQQYVSQGAYLGSGGWKYANSSYAPNLYYQSSGAHAWSAAAVGVAGNAISWVQTATLDASGNYTITGTATKPGGGSWTATSDGRTKQNVTPYTDGLAAILALSPQVYEYNGLGGTVADGKQYVGFIAQDVQPILPRLVGSTNAKLNPEDTEDTAILNIDDSSLVYVLVNAVKDLASQVTAQAATIAQLQQQIAALQVKAGA